MVAGELQWWRPWSQPERHLLTELTLGGLSRAQIAKRLCRTPRSVRHVQARLGLVSAGVRSPAWPPERLAEARRLRAKGLTFSQVARKLGGTTRSAVIGQLHRHGA